MSLSLVMVMMCTRYTTGNMTDKLLLESDLDEKETSVEKRLQGVSNKK